MTKVGQVPARFVARQGNVGMQGSPEAARLTFVNPDTVLYTRGVGFRLGDPVRFLPYTSRQRFPIPRKHVGCNPAFSWCFLLCCVRWKALAVRDGRRHLHESQDDAIVLTLASDILGRILIVTFAYGRLHPNAGRVYFAFMILCNSAEDDMRMLAGRSLMHVFRKKAVLLVERHPTVATQGQLEPVLPYASCCVPNLEGYTHQIVVPL